ncbi:hypothetical protein [Mucilaginibacter sp.]|uniref:hypothetical protein n=1 Tax=Mucilaginibacter sp. TaxID=1882438 RepID=UPI003263AD38
MKNILITISLLLFGTTLLAQQKTVAVNDSLKATYQGGDIIIGLVPPVFNGDSLHIDIVRKGADGTKQIKTNYRIPAGKLSQLADTSTRRAPGVYQYLVNVRSRTTLLQSKKVWGYAFAPDAKPLATDLKAINKKGTNNIAISWSIANNYAMRSAVLMRSRKKDRDYSPITTVTNTDSIYVDKVNDAHEPFFYRLDMTNVVTGEISSSASIFVLPDYAILPLAITNLKATQKDNVITVTWDTKDENTRGFYIKKRTANRDSFVVASTVITKSKTSKYLWKDSTSTLVNNQMYQYVVIPESNSFNKGIATDTATVLYSKAHTPLSPPQDLRIISNDTTYNLAWSVDSARMTEMAAYAVYYKKANETTFKPLPNGLVRAALNYVALPKPQDGDKYQVKAVNGDTQSVFSLPFTYKNAFEKNFGPKYLKAAVIDKQLFIKWLIGGHLTVKEYRLYKYNGKAFVLTDTIPAGKDVIATLSYKPGQLNIYQLKTLNTDNIESSGSNVLQVN